LFAANVNLTTSIAVAPLTPSQVNVLCLALREAVTNIVRHAHSSECYVRLAGKDGMIHFAVEDNGRGGVIREGNGLRGMRERVQSIAGTVIVTASESGGTRVEIQLPEESDAPMASWVVRGADAP
jgi:two-component system sensor histidine kinase DesK